ncbi:MAG TPA: radical SAM protein, partial [Longilinea sp.]|nr:radical SAM protein [Longilinea sp.]
MIVREIQTKTLLSSVRQPDDWFGLRYNLNLYRGCQHQCIYCDTRSECYQIEDFEHEILVKANALELLADELPRKRVKGTIGTGSMNDPYQPIELERNLTGRAMQIIARNRFPVHILTKSDLVVRDLDVIREIAKVYAAVSFTITAADDGLSRQLEPGAPATSKRLEAISKFSQAGIYTGVLLMPVLPFIEDTEENIRGVIRQTAEAGGKYVLAAMGLTLRDRQREYYYAALDRNYPGLSQRYRTAYGDRYHAEPPNSKKLYALVAEECSRLGLSTR